MSSCDNENCKKAIITMFSCKQCNSNYCSNSCMIEHVFDKHKGQFEQGIASLSIKLPNRSSVISPFLKKGEFLNDVKYDPYFDYQNLIKVKIGGKVNSLGNGAFGDVFLTKNKLDDKFYAVKQMQKSKIDEAGASRDIIVREISIHCRLNHENVVKLYSYEEDEDSYYLILEHANAGTLFSLIKKQKAGLDELTAFKYFIQAAAAVQFLHEHGLVHRDIKPENLLLTEDGVVKLCDFGWCVELAMGNRQTFCGTYEYMAPEVIREKPYNQSIDVWSLGILLYELLHGYSPFRAKTNNEEEEEYNEIFRNIVKYNFTIDKPLSENCADMLKSILKITFRIVVTR
jgi:serine/threonine protein kinase